MGSLINLSNVQYIYFSKVMSEADVADIDYKEYLKARPVTRVGYHPKNYSLHTSSNYVSQRIGSTRKSELPPRPTINRPSLAPPVNYLHKRLLNVRQTQAPLIVNQLETKLKIEDLDKPQVVLKGHKTRKTLSTAKTDHVIPSSRESRPSTSYNEKAEYFEELCSGHEALRAYKIMSHIGKGAFSVVSMAIGKQDQKPYAIKTYEKIESLDWNRLANIKREIRHLKSLDHNGVVRLIDVVRQRKKLYIILENGGKHSLGGILRKERIIPEAKCLNLFKQILKGIAYCHNKGVCHRDLKPENVLIDEHGEIKIIDFGFSANSKTMLNNYCGTPAYMAPEIIKKQPYNGAKADIWSLGVILYLMMVGTLPFRATNQQELNRLITQGKYRYRDEGSVPVNVRRVISSMLQVNPLLRPSAQEVLEDSWFQ